LVAALETAEREIERLRHVFTKEADGHREALAHERSGRMTAERRLRRVDPGLQRTSLLEKWERDYAE
jgi:hypothetical protein